MPDLEAVVERQTLAAAAGLQLQRHHWPVALGVLDVFPVHVLAEAHIFVLPRTKVLHRAKAVLVEDRHDALDAHDHRLGVRQRDFTDVETLLSIRALLCLEDLLDEELLEPLIGQVDAELLETVRLQALKAIDVEGADTVEGALARCSLLVGSPTPCRADVAGTGLIDFLDDLVKQALVEDLDDALQRLGSLCLRAGALDVRGAAILLAFHMHLTPHEHLLQAVLGEAQQVGGLGQGILPVASHLHPGLLHNDPFSPIRSCCGPIGLGLCHIWPSRSHLLELHLAKVDQRPDHIPDVLLHVAIHKRGKGLAKFGKLLREAFRLRRILLKRHSAADRKQVVPRRGIQLQLIQSVTVQACEDLVEDMVVPLALLLANDARALKQVRLDVCADEGSHRVEAHLVVLPESRGVHVSHGTRVAEGLEDGIRVHDLVLDAPAMRGIRP
mmetsp:Transcript_127600/g.272050  ORF Transcript_127600/g.272050 Transcript_127600/m.272050 type:complete len:442 (+) Transcript_127600:2388-3713(+)